MLSIDEAIENLKYDIEIDMYIRDIAPQLAEWLEELKSSRQELNELRKYSYVQGLSDGYINAIDDFAEKMNAKCDGIIKEKWNSNVSPISWAEAYADFKDDIDEIAEQLKSGEIYD